MKPDVFHVGVIVEQASTAVVIVKVRADSLVEAQVHAQRSLTDKFLKLGSRGGMLLDQVLDWETEEYTVQGIDATQNWAIGYGTDVDLSDEPTIAEKRLAEKQEELPL